MTPSNIVQGRLMLGSYIKLFFIGSVGVLPIFIIFNLVSFLFDLSQGVTVPLGDGDTNIPATFFWPIYLIKFAGEILGILISCPITGLCSYPFYSLLCSRGNGIILKGKFGVML
jgi:hypothetical protein